MRKRLDLTRRKLDHTRLAAPAAGMIAEVLAEVDENVSAGQPVVVLASGSAPEVGFAVPEVLIRRIREGMAVTVRFDAIPEVRFAGAVTEVGVATLATGTTFPVTVRLNSNAAEIRPGMAAALDIVFGEKAAPDRFNPARGSHQRGPKRPVRLRSGARGGGNGSRPAPSGRGRGLCRWRP